MTDSSTEFFEALNRKQVEPLLQRAHGSLRVDLEQDGSVEHWRVEIEQGKVQVSHSDQPADSVLRTDRALFDEIAAGRANPMAAVLRGAVQVQGDPELLVAFQRALPGPPSSRPQTAPNRPHT